MPIYNKLVRDLIPDIIQNAGKSCTIRIISGEERVHALHEKLEEEINEYRAADTHEQAKEELADILEVIKALAEAQHSSMEEIEAIRKRKEEERGGFERGIVLLEVQE
jgi:predicted house-cleaning noncanonical NTP pyrophosphatase (MazG superfamily)